MPPPPIPNSASLQLAWPKRGLQSPGPMVSIPGQLMNKLNVPDFFKHAPAFPGYQEAHKMYSDMRDHFAQRAYTTRNFELVIVKVTMMSMKPGNKNPSIVSVCKYLIGSLACSDIFTEHFRNHQQRASSYWSSRPQSDCISDSAGPLFKVVEECSNFN
jgi:hypothetical protein